MSLVIIVAYTKNHMIGRGNAMPWHLPDDLKRFKAMTLGKVLLMGRKTFDSIGKPLPGRETVVLTRDKNWQHPGVRVLHTLDEALDFAKTREVIMAGGANLYAQLLPFADKLEVTEIDVSLEGDAYFPAVDPLKWQEASRIHHAQDGKHPYAFDFVTYHRT